MSHHRKCDTVSTTHIDYLHSLTIGELKAYCSGVLAHRYNQADSPELTAMTSRLVDILKERG